MPTVLAVPGRGSMEITIRLGEQMSGALRAQAELWGVTESEAALRLLAQAMDASIDVPEAAQGWLDFDTEHDDMAEAFEDLDP